MAATPSLYAPALRGLFSALGTDTILKIMGIAASVITLQQLDPYQYGLWQILLGIPIAFGVVTFPGIAGMLVADVSREIGAGNTQRAHGIAIKSAVLFLLLSAFGALAMYLTAPFIRSLSGINVVSLAQLLSITVFAVGVRQVYYLVLSSRLLFIHLQTIKAIERTTYFLALVYFLLFSGGGFTGVVYAYVIASVMPFVLYAPYVFGLLKESWDNHEPSEWEPFLQAVWQRGRWVVGTDTINTALGSLWPWVVGFFLGVEEVGLIGVTILMLSQVTAFIPIAFVLRSILPRTIESADRTKEWLMRTMKASLWGHFVVGTGVFFAAVILFPLLFPQHIAALPLFAALLLSLPIRGLATTTAEWFYSSRRQKDLFFITSLPKAGLFMLLPLFLWSGGLIGYALWYLLNSGVILLARLKVIRQHTDLDKNLRFLFKVDRVDIELIERAQSLITAKIRSFTATDRVAK